METEKTDINELSEKIMRGLKIAIKKLVEDTAAQNGSLVIGDKDGNILHVPAKDLLHTVQVDLDERDQDKELNMHAASLFRWRSWKSGRRNGI
jgi:hypothetical protein